MHHQGCTNPVPEQAIYTSFVWLQISLGIWISLLSSTRTFAFILPLTLTIFPRAFLLWIGLSRFWLCVLWNFVIAAAAFGFGLLSLSLSLSRFPFHSGLINARLELSEEPVIITTVRTDSESMILSMSSLTLSIRVYSQVWRVISDGCNSDSVKAWNCKPNSLWGVGPSSFGMVSILIKLANHFLCQSQTYQRLPLNLHQLKDWFHLLSLSQVRTMLDCHSEVIPLQDQVIAPISMPITARWWRRGWVIRWRIESLLRWTSCNSIVVRLNFLQFICWSIPK